VIARIFYTVNRSWSGRISVSELRRSSFLATLRLLQEEDDINQVTDFFSYEHFYVIYCKFWELDKATSCKYKKNYRLLINITILKVHLSLFIKTASWIYYSAAENFDLL
jgi:hypothetical protein